jgi:CubicO group peptidase (beta-lactamase class C family)
VTPPSYIAWHGASLADHKAKRDRAIKSGHRFASLSIYGDPSEPVYAAVMIKRSPSPDQHDFPSIPAGQFQARFDEETGKGRGPVIISATGSGDDARFAAVFEPQKPIALTRTALDADALKGMNRKAKAEGLILHWAALYGEEDDPRYAAIWLPNHAKVTWNADGIQDTAAQCRQRFDAQTSGWARPSFVTPGDGGHHLSVFSDDRIGEWSFFAGLSPQGYQQKFDDLTDAKKGFYPLVVQASGEGDDARFDGIFVKSEARAARHWHATGPQADAGIDGVVKQIMQGSPMRQAALAIVHRSRLVYARGYTWAEDGWPVTEPTTHFRIASCSKTVMALAIAQLLEEKKLSLDDSLQDVLHLRQPGGDAPNDGRFAAIKIRHLLEHTSGIDPAADESDVAIVEASGAHLPATMAQTDAYIPTRTLFHDPGLIKQYNNTGYYLLGRVLTKRRGTPDALTALKEHLFKPLGITRIRHGRSLLADQPHDEARYRLSLVDGDDSAKGLDIATGQSVMTAGRPLVPLDYGTARLERLEGSGGLSAAVPDLARIVAVWIGARKDTALKRSTVTMMLDEGIASAQKHHGEDDDRPGYGLDGAAKLSDGSYYGQKGGSLATSGAGLQFNGDWGFCVCWAGKSTVEIDGQGWYPDFSPVMSIATSQHWGTTDLFAHYGLK